MIPSTPMRLVLGFLFVLSACQLSVASPADSLKAKVDTSSVPAFKKAILEVFHSFYEAGYWDIRVGIRTAPNSWNYQNTYTTRLKIPGEKFNMLYCYPTASSTMDFVSVLKESDGFDPKLDALYHEFEKRLMKQFASSEGWVASCIVNAGMEKLPDLEIHKENYGSVVLDYSRTPRGRYILYLRFLMY